MKLDRIARHTIYNPFFWIGLGITMVGISLIFFGDAPQNYGYILQAITSDGRCTGFPNGIGQWQWGDCCQVHDIAGMTGVPDPQADGALAVCIISRVPTWATPLVFLGIAIMGFGRPSYNALKRIFPEWIK